MEAWVIALIVIFSLIGAAAIISVGAFLWKKGLRENSIFLTVVGAFMCLDILGVVIAILQLKRLEKSQGLN